jgi:hypothetical protein
MRGLLLVVEEYLGVSVDARERLIAFLFEYAAYSMNRLRKGEDGKTAYERIQGKKPFVLGVEFGDKVWYLKGTGKTMNELRSRWGQGIFVGVRLRSNQAMVATRSGVVSSPHLDSNGNLLSDLLNTTPDLVATIAWLLRKRTPTKIP